MYKKFVSERFAWGYHRYRFRVMHYKNIFSVVLLKKIDLYKNIWHSRAKKYAVWSAGGMYRKWIATNQYKKNKQDYKKEWMILTINVKTLKTKISIKRNKVFFSLTSGQIIRHIPESSKSLRKASSVTALQIKSTGDVLNKVAINHKVVVHFKGLTFNFSKTVNLLKKSFKKFKYRLIITPAVSFDKKKHRKKIRAVKKRLKKKFLIN